MHKLMSTINQDEEKGRNGQEKEMGIFSMTLKISFQYSKLISKGIDISLG